MCYTSHLQQRRTAVVYVEVGVHPFGAASLSVALRRLIVSLAA
jgi:hypothetical protein